MERRKLKSQRKRKNITKMGKVKERDRERDRANDRNTDRQRYRRKKGQLKTWGKERVR